MDSTAYILVAAASAATALVMWWFINPNQHRLKRVVIAVGAALLGYFVYFGLGFLLILLRPDLTHELQLAIAHGVTMLSVAFLVVACFILSVRRRFGTN